MANHRKNIYAFEILELIRRFPRSRRFPGWAGKGVRSHKPEPPKHTQESSDEVSSQQALQTI